MSAKWKRLSDPRVLKIAGIKIPEPSDHKKSISKIRYITDPETKLHTLRTYAICAQQERNRLANIERRRLAAENMESIKSEVARFRKAKADGLFERLFYPSNANQPCPFK